MKSENTDLKYVSIFVIAAVLLFLFFQELVTSIVLGLIVIAVSFRYSKTKPTLVGNMILSFLTLTMLFSGFRIAFFWVHYNFYVWLLLLSIAISIYGIAAAEVSKYFGLPTSEKLSNISPSLISSLEIVFPGVGFTYLGKQKGKNYTTIGLAIFSVYLITALALTFVFKTPGLIFYSYIFVFRLVTPIIAYRTVKRLKSK